MKPRKIVFAGALAALYAALVYMNAAYSFGPVQLRLAEALTVLPFLFPEAVPGLFAGCLIANLVSQFGLPDIVFGSLATLLAAWLTSRCKHRWMAPLPPILVNMAVVGALITLYTPGKEATLIAFAANALLIGVSQAAACAGLGIPLLLMAEKARLRKFLG